MEIVSDISGLEEKLVEFNQRNWPMRNMDFLESLNWRTRQNPFSNEAIPYIFVALEKDQVIGQIVLIHSVLVRGGQRHPMVWGTDLMVDSAYRGTSAGVSLTRKALKSGIHFGSGFSPESEKLHLVLGEKKVGEIDKYVGPTSLKRMLSLKSNLQSIKANGEVFRSVEPAQLGKFQTDELTYFDRNEAFFTWRFGDNFGSYACYINEDSSCYFVIRRTKVNSIPMLKMVDYRFTDERQFIGILDALDQLAGAQKMPTKFVSASTPGLKLSIQKAGFSKKRSSPILSNFKELTVDELFVTPADSDGDFWG